MVYMKTRNFVFLDILLAGILILLGALIETRGEDVVAGVATIFLILPGVSMIVCLLLDNIKLKNVWIRIVIYGAIIIAADIIAIIAMSIPMTAASAIIGLIISMAATTGLNFAFYVIFSVIKEEPGQIQVK